MTDIILTTSANVPPPGYVFRGDLFADWDSARPAWQFLVLANLLALIPLGAAVLLLWLPYQLYAALGAPLALLPNPTWPEWGYWLFGLAAVILSMLLHEGLHGAALILLGCRPRFGYSGGYLYATVAPGQYLTRRVYLIMVLTPLVATSLVGGTLLPFLPDRLGQIVVLVLLLNAAASISDLVVALRARRWPPETRFGEFGGIKVFTPEATIEQGT